MFDQRTVLDLVYTTLFHTVVLDWFHRPAMRMIRTCRPECIDGNRAESIPACVVRARRRGKTAALTRHETLSIVRYSRTTSLIRCLFLKILEQVDECRHPVFIQTKPSVIPARSRVLVIEIVCSIH